MGGTSRALAYLYDANSNRIRITHPDGNRFETDHDALGRPTMLWANEYTAMASMGYYAHGAAAGSSLANGATREWGFDAVQRVSAVVHNAAGTSADLIMTLGYNPASQIGSRTLYNDSYAWLGHYAVNRPYTTNGLNQYTATGGPAFAYDANGNLTSDGSRSYAYDVENRLISNSNGATLAYDPLGRLSQVTLGASTTRFLYDGDALVAEYDGSNTMTRRYAHWVGADVPLLSYAGATLNQPSYLHADQQGSIILITDQNGNPSINRYDEYGIPAGSNVGRFQYTGQAFLAELGMYHYKARIYSPTLGRFLQTDPVGYQGGINLYGYVNDDPVNMTDPDGQNPAIDGRVAGLMSLSPDERLEALGYIGGALSVWLPGPEDVLFAAWIGRTIGSALVSRSAVPAARRAWRPGQSPHARTRAGNAPSRRTITRREWQNEADRPTRPDFTAEHMERMSRGQPPQRVNPDNPRNGGVESMERSHEPVPLRNGGTETRPRWPPEHEAVDPCRRTGYCRR